jgi:hypothetical protein
MPNSLYAASALRKKIFKRRSVFPGLNGVLKLGKSTEATDLIRRLQGGGHGIRSNKLG